jgi:hypothetical protein
MATAKKTPVQKPRAPDAESCERSLVGAVLSAPERVMPIVSKRGLEVDHFTDAEARQVWGAITRLSEAGSPIDAITVASESGLSALTLQVMIDSGIPAHCEYFADAIRDRAIKRNALSAINSADGATAIRMACESITAGLPTDQRGGGAVTASDWLKESDTPEEPVIKGLFDTGDRVAVVGQSKARKSFYALQMAVCISAGEPFLGYETERMVTLVYNGEIKASAYRRRLRRMIEVLQIGADKLTGLHVLNGAEADTAATFDSILAEARRVKAGLVIADPAYMLIDGDETDQTAVKAAVTSMKKFGTAGITLVCVYHGTKGKMGDRQAIDRIAGSGIFARDMATLVSLVEHASEVDHAVMTTITRNHAPVEPVSVKFADGAFSVADSIAAIEKTSQTKAVRAISIEDLAACFRTEPTSYGDTVAAIRQRLGVGRDRAKDEVARAVREGVAHAEQSGRSTLYSIRTDMA